MPANQRPAFRESRKRGECVLFRAREFLALQTTDSKYIAVAFRRIGAVHRLLPKHYYEVLAGDLE
jgi:hypothetical protein